MPPQALALFQVIFQLLDKLCCCALLLCCCCTLLLLCLEKNDSSVLKAHTFFRGVIKNTKSLTLTSSFVKTFRVFKKTLSMESCCYFFVISSVDELIDVIEGNRKYLRSASCCHLMLPCGLYFIDVRKKTFRCLYVVNKIDNVSMLEVLSLHTASLILLECPFLSFRDGPSGPATRHNRVLDQNGMGKRLFACANLVLSEFHPGVYQKERREAFLSRTFDNDAEFFHWNRLQRCPPVLVQQKFGLTLQCLNLRSNFI